MRLAQDGDPVFTKDAVRCIHNAFGEKKAVMEKLCSVGVDGTGSVKAGMSKGCLFWCGKQLPLPCNGSLWLSLPCAVSGWTVGLRR